MALAMGIVSVMDLRDIDCHCNYYSSLEGEILVGWLIMVAWTLICFLIGYAGGRWDAKK